MGKMEDPNQNIWNASQPISVGQKGNLFGSLHKEVLNYMGGSIREERKEREGEAKMDTGNPTLITDDVLIFDMSKQCHLLFKKMGNI